MCPVPCTWVGEKIRTYKNGLTAPLMAKIDLNEALRAMAENPYRNKTSLEDLPADSGDDYWSELDRMTYPCGGSCAWEDDFIHKPDSDEFWKWTWSWSKMMDKNDNFDHP